MSCRVLKVLKSTTNSTEIAVVVNFGQKVELDMIHKDGPAVFGSYSRFMGGTLSLLSIQ